MYCESQNKRCLVFITVISAFQILIFFFYMGYKVEVPFSVCDIIDRNKMRFADVNMEANDEEAVDYHHGFRDKWKSIDAEESAYVFSAYMIPEDFHTNWFDKLRLKFAARKGYPGPKTIMIVGATSSYSLKFHCHIWYNKDNGAAEPLVTMATMLELDTDDNMKFQSNLFACSIPDWIVPWAVSLTTSKCTTPTHKLLLKESVKNHTRDFTMCLPPMFGRSNLVHAQRFIEWVELNRILGANHFTVYNHSIGQDMNHILQIFEKRGLIEIVQWELPMNKIYYYAEHAAINDCLLRNRFKSKYVINSDMDEFIIPHGKDVLTWNEMLQYLSKESAYSFRSAFFHNPKDVKNIALVDKKVPRNISKLITLTNFIRDKKFYRDRVKYMVNSDSAQRIKIHCAYDLRWGREITVDPSLAFLHHYRTDQIKGVTFDTTIYDKYASSLAKIENIYKEFHEND